MVCFPAAVFEIAPFFHPLTKLFIFPFGSSQVLGWLPPLVFSALVTANIRQSLALIATSAFLAVSIAFLMMAGTWEEILQEGIENSVVPISAREDAEEAKPKDDRNEGEDLNLPETNAT